MRRALAEEGFAPDHRPEDAQRGDGPLFPRASSASPSDWSLHSPATRIEKASNQIMGRLALACVLGGNVWVRTSRRMAEEQTGAVNPCAKPGVHVIV